MGREEHYKQISLVCVGTTCRVWTTLGLPQLTVPVLSPSTLLRLHVTLKGNCPKRALGCVLFPGLSCSGSGSWVLHKDTDSVGLAFCALPRSEELRRPDVCWAHYSRCTVCLITSPVPAAWFPGCAAKGPSQVCCVSSPWGWSQMDEFLEKYNLPKLNP